MHSNIKLDILRTSHENPRQCYTSLRSSKTYTKSNLTFKCKDNLKRKSLKNGSVSYLCKDIIKKESFFKKSSVINSSELICNTVRPHDVNNIVSRNILLHNRKHVKLKSDMLIKNTQKDIYVFSKYQNSDTNNLFGCLSADKLNSLLDESVSSKKYEVSSNMYVLESSKRIEFIKNYDFQYKQVNFNLELHDTLVKNQDLEIIVTLDSDFLSSDSDLTHLQHKINNRQNETHYGKLFVCKWADCIKKFTLPDKLVRHVQNKHIQKDSNQCTFTCLWQNCKFFNQPSSSYKWLITHVLRHFDLKPFKCVIHGCDGSFATQNGLARHVPTHFNNGKVRRACVKNSCETKNMKENNEVQINSKRISKINVELSQKSCLKLEEELSLNKNIFLNQKSIAKSNDFNSQILKKIKRKLQQPLCGSSNSSGYVNKCLRLQHKVIGRRTSTTTGLNEVLVSPTHDVLNDQSFWLDANALGKCMYVDIPVHQLSECYKGLLYDAEKKI
uniref:Zinc finger protein AEBP2 n=1 Tax=Hydra vulgaris TaxID=6087 RepID=T2MBM4_HYDVU